MLNMQGSRNRPRLVGAAPDLWLTERLTLFQIRACLQYCLLPAILFLAAENIRQASCGGNPASEHSKPQRSAVQREGTLSRHPLKCSLTEGQTLPGFYF